MASVFKDKIGMARFVTFPDNYIPAMVRSSTVGYPPLLYFWRFVPFGKHWSMDYCWYQWQDAMTDPVERDWTKIRFMWDNLFDSATLTPSSEELGFEAELIQHRWIHRHWRSNSGGEQSIVIDLGSAQDVTCFILNYHWWLPTSDIRIQANATDSWGTPSVDVALDVHYPMHPLVKFWSSAQTYRYWRLYVNSEDETEVVIRGDWDDCPYCNFHHRVGRIFLGTYWEPDINISRGFTTGEIDDVRKVVSLPGAMSSHKEEIYKKIEYEWQWMTEDDKDNLTEMFDDRGRSNEFWVCENEKFWWKKTYYVSMNSDIDFELVSEYLADSQLWSTNILLEGMR